MALGNWTFNISVSDVDESLLAGETPADYVLRLAEAKARAAVASARSDQFIVAADTSVVDGDTILGKPGDSADAVRMLKRLRGHKHQVYTGLALLTVDRNELLKDLSVTDVPMRNYSDAEIDSYVRTGDPLDKAGAYAIQHAVFKPVVLPDLRSTSPAEVEGMSGCFASVMGLPLCHLLRLFRALGKVPDADLPAGGAGALPAEGAGALPAEGAGALPAEGAGALPARCQMHLNYQCPVSSSILQGQAGWLNR